jgi:hypothetical protein
VCVVNVSRCRNIIESHVVIALYSLKQDLLNSKYPFALSLREGRRLAFDTAILFRKRKERGKVLSRSTYVYAGIRQYRIDRRVTIPLSVCASEASGSVERATRHVALPDLSCVRASSPLTPSPRHPHPACESRPIDFICGLADP